MLNSLHRTYCDTLYEMRELLSSATEHNFRPTVEILQSLVEECQVYGNRMEAGLGQRKDIIMLSERISELKKEKRKLESIVGSLSKDTYGAIGKEAHE